MKLKFQIAIIAGVLLLLFIIFKNELIFFLNTSSATVNIISILGTLVTIGSFIYALYERDMRQQLEDKRRSQLWASIDRSRFTIFDHNLIKEIQEELQHEQKHRIWLNHQAACDLYISLIEQYLSTIEKFTYQDLKNLCLNGVIFWKWQERQWRILICQRPENKTVIPPEYFIETEWSPYQQERINKKKNREM